MIQVFTGLLRDECLKQHRFLSLDEARAVAEARREDYNRVRPLESIVTTGRRRLWNAVVPHRRDRRNALTRLSILVSHATSCVVSMSEPVAEAGLQPAHDASAARPRGRIAFLTSCPLLWGGSEELWSGAALALHQRGFRVHAARSRPWPWAALHPRWEALRRAGVSLGCFRVRGLEEAAPDAVQRFMPLFAGPAYRARDLWLALKLRRCRAELVVISQGGSYDGIWPVNLPEICRAAGVPYVLICQKSSEADWPSDSLRRLIQRGYADATGVFFVSEHNRRITSQQLGTEFERAEVVRNPTLVTTPGPLPWPEPVDGRIRLACVGRMWPMEKGQDLLLNVLARDRWRGRAVEVDFYGEGPIEQGLREMARHLNLTNVHFRGHVSNITDVWRDHHALVLPSRAEGLALAQVEAMQCGRPPIVAAAGGARELVDNGVEGFIAPAATEDEVDAAMERAWQRRNEWAAIGRRAAERVARDVPADPCAAFADRLENLIDAVHRT